jgi:serine/threonine protein kinase
MGSRDMSEHDEAPRGDGGTAGVKEDDRTALSHGPAPGEFEILSLYDSLLRGVAAATGGPGPGEATATPDLRIDAEVGPQGKFVLRQEIGGGGMGRVYRALDRYLLRDVAIKFILRPEGMNQDDFMALFWQEAHIIARLDQHDNIVRILDVDRSTYPPFIVMEYLDGQSLEKQLRHGRLDAPAILQIMIAVARGLGEAHRKGVCHRDLKPSNIFIQNTGRVKLLDFGLAQIRNHLFETSTSKASFVAVQAVPPLASAGTPAYMAPEQWRGEEADATTDLWAMGAILYRLFAQALPFDADTLAALAARVLSGEPPVPLITLCPDAPVGVCELVERLLRFERSQRPGQVSEIIPVLEAELHRLASDAPQPGLALAAMSRSLNPASEIQPSVSAAHRGAEDSVPEGAVHVWDKMLLVLVTGADADPCIVPEHLPAWILRKAGLDCEVVHCLPVEMGNVDEAAIRLRAYLNASMARPRHMFFITHGAGTDAVLRMLLDEARRLRRPDDGGFELDNRSPFYRVRHVAICRSGRGVATAHHVAGLHASVDTAPLVAELVAETQHFLAATLPSPAIHYFGTDDDGAALHAGSPAVKALAAMLARPEMVLARETIAKTFELDCASRIASLIGPIEGDPTGDVSPTVPGANAATQAEVFDDLLIAARLQHHRPVAIVITGDAGVGKSTVLRMAARRLCSELIMDGSAVIPILIPLYFASLTAGQRSALDRKASENQRGRVFLDILLDWWCDWFNGTSYTGAVRRDWILACLRSEPVMLIFDGVDEFISNHPTLTISDFQRMLAFLGAEHRKNGWLTSVLGVRSTQPGLPLLASNNLREVLRLTTAQAMRQFPAASSWLIAGSPPPLHKLLSTPLILAQLHSRRPSATPLASTSGEVILLALTTIIEQSDLCGRLDETGQPIEAQRWIDALTAIAWCMFRRLRGETATETLRIEGAELHRSWQDHLERTEQQIQGEHLLSGFRLLGEARAFDALLQRTILYPTGRGEVRFIHREWQDFLAARYLAQVVMYRHVDEFRHVGNTARISQLAGELLGQTVIWIDEAFVLALLRHAQNTGARLLTANFSALLTNSRIPMEGPAIDAFLSAVNSAPPVARFITLSGLGYRALRGDDASAQDLRHRLVRVFRDQLSARGVDGELGVMHSLAWCYLKAFAQRFGGPAMPEPWAGLGDDAERGALAMMCSVRDEGPRFLVEHRSIQIALLEVQQVVPEDAHRPISGVHYLYCLVVARRHGGGIAELGRELPSLLAHGSPYATAVENYPFVPELRDILAVCRQLELPP